ncbi:hypothetical protein OC842_001223 [Tilletia horrida]|uniref:Uncharacterized protein n=1 Tax=Tilletia horrida TaxID=155126 RepID=A0AAN6JM67_9BASI|nr:hypothetical protein OC842_001223 [Tilletia horrida]
MQHSSNVFLRYAVDHLLRAVADDHQLKDFARRIEAARRGLDETLEPDSREILRSVTLVRQLAACFLQLEHQSGKIRTWLSTEATRIVQAATNTPEALAIRSTTTASDSLNASLLRQWFLDNLVNPTPDKEEKEDLVRRTNALPDGGLGGRDKKPLTYQQVTADHALVKLRYVPDVLSSLPRCPQVLLWFINMRRRSGWTEFKQLYGRRDKPKFEKLLKALERQPSAPPSGTKDEVAALMHAWNVPLQSELAEGTTADDSDDEDDCVAPNKGRRGQPRRSASSNSSKKMAPSSKTAAAKDPKGSLRAKECREAYDKMVDFVSAGQKERVRDWLGQVLKDVEKKPKVKKRASAPPPAKASSSGTKERKVAKLPTRASQRQKASQVPLTSTPVKSTAALSTPSTPFSPPSRNGPSSISTVFSPRKPAQLPGTENGPRLPSTMASQGPIVPVGFWQSSQASSSGAQATSSAALPNGPVSSFTAGMPASTRSGSGDSANSNSTAYTQYSTQTSLSLPSSQSSQASSYPLFVSGVGIGDGSLVRSTCSSVSSCASDVEVGEPSSPEHKRLLPPAQVPSQGKLLSYGVGENSDFASEPQAKRARPGSRPRHTDGGATSSLLASAQHQQLSPLPLNQNGAMSPTMPLLSLNLNLSMLASAAVPSFNTTSHHHQQQQQQYSYSAMTTPIHGTQGNESSSIGAWYQPAPTPFYPMAVDAHFAANVLMGAAQGSLGMGMGSVRAVSSPERFTEYHEAAAGATQSSPGQL